MRRTIAGMSKGVVFQRLEQAFVSVIRKSLTKLQCTNIEDPDTDLDVVKNRLVGRDELEIYRIKQMENRKASSIAHSIAMEDEDDAK